MVPDATRWFGSRNLWLALSAVAIGYLAVRWYLLLTSSDPLLGVDARAYWGAAYNDPYHGPPVGLPGAYLYSPAFLQAIAPFRLLPFEAFHALWAAVGFASLIYLLGPIGAALAVTALPFVFRDLLVGNIHLLMGVAIVVGLRHPAVWALPILTKVTPVTGMGWFVGRRDWRGLSTALGATAAISLASFAIASDLWFAWFERLRGDSGTAGDLYMLVIVIRVAVATGVAWYAGRTGRDWLLPFAVVISLPILWPDSLAILMACFPLLRTSRRSQ